MQRTWAVIVLVLCLGMTLAVGGCLFGGKGGDEQAASTDEAAAPGGPADEAAGPDAGAPTGAPPASGPPPGMAAGAAGGPPGAPPGPAGPAGDPAQAKSLVAQAKQAKAAGDYAKALPLLEQAVAADSGNLDAHWVMAWICAEQGNKQRAAAEFGAFIAAAGDDPRVADAKAALGRLGPPAGGPPGAGGGMGGPKPPAPPTGG